MSFSLSNRALLRGMLAGAVVLTGTACSRSDRSESGRDNGAAVLPDTSNNPADTSTATESVNDTATTPAQPSTAAESNTPRSGTAPAGDKGAAGYRSMERDTTDVPSQDSDSARVTADTAEVSSVSSDTTTTNSAAAADTGATDASASVADTASIETAGAADTTTSADVSADTTAAGYAEMARDTSTVADQVDTAATPNGDVALQASIDTSAQANADVRAEAGVAVADTGRIRPPEDSTEILGADPAADETADEQVIRPEDRETVAASEAPTDEVGAAAIGGNVTGSEAAALITREGVRCAVVDPENNEAVRWDMSSTPVTLNPCGMGSMNLSRIWTEK